MGFMLPPWAPTLEILMYITEDGWKRWRSTTKSSSGAPLTVLQITSKARSTICLKTHLAPLILRLDINPLPDSWTRSRVYTHMIPHITDRAGAIYWRRPQPNLCECTLSTYMRLDWKALAGATESNYRHWEMSAAPAGAVRVFQDLA